MKLKPVTLETRKPKKKLSLTSYQQVVTSFFFSDLWLIWRNQDGLYGLQNICMVCKIYILVNSKFLSYKNWKQY